MSRPENRTRAAPAISILIVTYNSAPWIHTCLEKVFASQTDAPFEVLVVDNASRDGTPERVERDWGGRDNFRLLVQRRNIGFAAANVVGYRAARGRIILLLNPDAFLPPDALAAMEQFLRAQPDIGALGPRLFDETGAIEDSYRRFPTVLDVLIKRTFLRNWPRCRARLGRYLMWDRDPEDVQDVDWVHGACMMLHRRAIDDLGHLFDTRFFLFYEEIDLCRRLWDRGWRVTYVPTIEVFHQKARLSAGSVHDVLRKRTIWRHLESAAKYHLKHALRPLPRRRGGLTRGPLSGDSPPRAHPRRHFRPDVSTS